MALWGRDANEIERARISMMARGSKAPSIGRIQKRKTNFSKSSLSACNARPATTGHHSCRQRGQGFRTFQVCRKDLRAALREADVEQSDYTRPSSDGLSPQTAQAGGRKSHV